MKTELATFFEVFPNGTLWSNNLNGDGYDLVLIGQADATLINVDELQQRLEPPGYTAVSASISEVGFHSGVEVLATYAGRASELRPLLAHAQSKKNLNMRSRI